jgi:xanthine/uracil permease
MFPFTSGVFLGLSTLLVFVGAFVFVVPWLRRAAGPESSPPLRKRTVAILIPALLVATTIASVWYIAFWRALH